MGWQYKVVPFVASAKSGSSSQQRAQAAAEQFQTLLHQGNAEGWEYLRMDHYSLFESPGCLTELLGAKATVVTYDVAVFRRAA